MNLFLYILFLHRFADFSFYGNGSDLFVVCFFGFYALAYLIINRYKFNSKSFLYISIFFIFLLVLNNIIATYLPDSFLYYMLLLSLVMLFFYFHHSEVTFKWLNTLFMLGLVNIVFVIVEVNLKINGYFDLEIIPFSFYINEVNSIGGILYQSELNALFLNSTAFISLYYLFNSHNSFSKKSLFITVYLTAIVLAIYTATRASMVAMCIAIILFFTAATFKKFDRPFRNKLVVIFLIYLSILLITKFLPLSFHNPLAKFALNTTEDYSILSRLNIWFTQVLMFLDHPFFGVGLDNFKYLNAPYQVESVKILKLPFEAIGNFTFGHNEFLQLLCEGGIFLILPLLFISYKVVKKAIISVNEKNIFLYLVIVIFVIQSCFSWPLRHPALMLYFVIIIACITSQYKTTNSGIIKDAFSFKWICDFFIILFIVLYTFFFISYGKALSLELYYKTKAQHEKKFFNALLYLDKLSHNKYLYFGANHTFVEQAYLYISKDVFDGVIPLTKELYKKLDQKKLFHYDKIALVNITEEKSRKLYKLREYWYYYYISSVCEILKGNYQNAYEEAKRAEELNPNDDRVYALMHFANVLKAAKIKNIDVLALLPSEREVEKLVKEFKSKNK